MPVLIELTDRIFGRWTVIGAAFMKAGKTFWRCRCSCGTLKTVNGKHLRNGESTQCRGCAHRTHGETNGAKPSTEYTVWQSMLARCDSPTNRAYARYGARGITVCDRWRSFDAFLADMGRRPEGMTLDRRNNEKGYSPDNCRWATHTQQNRNRRDNRLITAFGETRCLAEWTELRGVDRGLIRDRLRRGWSPERAINGPSLAASAA